MWCKSPTLKQFLEKLSVKEDLTRDVRCGKVDRKVGMKGPDMTNLDVDKRIIRRKKGS
jgi:hypothetical protein